MRVARPLPWGSDRPRRQRSLSGCAVCRRQAARGCWARYGRPWHGCRRRTCSGAACGSRRWSRRGSWCSPRRAGHPLGLRGGRRHQGVHEDGRELGGAELIEDGHALLREFGTEGSRRSPRSTRWPSAAAASWRWPATSGSPPSRRLRAARGQARDHPRLRRHPAAAAAGRPAEGARDEPDRRRDHRPARRYEFGLVNRIVTRPRAVRHRPRLGAQARRPGADRGRADQEASPTRATSTMASRPRRPASPPRSSARTPRRASAPSSASGRRSGRASSRTTARTSAADQLAELIGRRAPPSP